ncbi:hypothetical protein F2Q70_00023727 [Brassica cretica]|uniref:RNase H type-1 domain-containing protein n=1 Tax=Brassica cretica TaxID=69181 RepID=A0A8S9GSD0_BRACR|nr:hypothetical protein F2Q70_00023727 [Brassica cretica]
MKLTEANVSCAEVPSFEQNVSVGKFFEAVRKAKEEADSWFLAQQVQIEMELTEANVSCAEVPSFEQNISVGWVQCEFDMDWSSRGKNMGPSWIVKDEKGKVLEHSRRAFSEVKSVGEAKLQLWLWVMESMKSLRKKKVSPMLPLVTRGGWISFMHLTEVHLVTNWFADFLDPILWRCRCVVADSSSQLSSEIPPAFSAQFLLYRADEIVRKAKEEADSWFLAQHVQIGMELTEANVSCAEVPSFEQNVSVGWVQCEFDMDWSSRGKNMGASWIVKDEKGKVLEHSRRAFSEVKSVGEAKLQLWLWVMESMKSLRKKKVRCASFIVQSVRNLGLTQSYVAAGHPRWLDQFYASD